MADLWWATLGTVVMTVREEGHPSGVSEESSDRGHVTSTMNSGSDSMEV